MDDMNSILAMVYTEWLLIQMLVVASVTGEFGRRVMTVRQNAP